MVFGPTPTGNPKYDPIWAIDKYNYLTNLIL
jgi:hypothetical protein